MDRLGKWPRLSIRIPNPCQYDPGVRTGEESRDVEKLTGYPPACTPRGGQAGERGSTWLRRPLPTSGPPRSRPRSTGQAVAGRWPPSGSPLPDEPSRTSCPPSALICSPVGSVRPVSGLGCRGGAAVPPRPAGPPSCSRRRATVRARLRGCRRIRSLRPRFASASQVRLSEKCLRSSAGVSEERAERRQKRQADHRGERAGRVAYEGAYGEAEHARHGEGPPVPNSAGSGSPWEYVPSGSSAPPTR